MNVNFEKIDDLHGEVTVILEEKDYADKVKKQLKDFGKTHAEPGFRPGHVPAGLIQRKYGNAVKYDVVNKEVSEVLYNYIKENKIEVLGNPVPCADNNFKIENTEFTFKFKVGLAPEIIDPVNKDLHVPYYNIIVSDEMVNEEVGRMQQRFGRQVPGEEVEPNALVKGVVSELNADGTVKEGGIVVENGIVSPQHFTDEAQRALFAGKKVGENVVFNPFATCNGNETELSSMLNIDKEDVENHKGDFSFEIKEIIVVRPAELDQEFFENVFGKDKVDSEESFRKEVKGIIEAGVQNDSNYRFNIDAKNVIMEKVGALQLPDDVLKEFLIQNNENLNAENIDEEYGKIRSSIEWDLVRNKVAENLGVKVEEEDMLNAARSIVHRQMMQYGIANMAPEQIDGYAREILKDRNATNRLYEGTLTGKMFAAVKEAVTLDEKSVSVDEYRDLYKNEEAAAE